jgi:hypothetical protein
MFTPADPIRVPTINLTGDELDAIKVEIAGGLLPPNYLELHKAAVAKNVFGHDAVKDRHGNYLEQGVGAKGHESANHFAALKKAEAMGIELPGTYDKAIAEIWKRDPERPPEARLARKAMMSEPLNKMDFAVFGEDAQVDPVTGRLFESGLGCQPRAVQAARFLREHAAENDRPKEGDSCPYSGRPLDCSVGALPKSIQIERFFNELPEPEKARWFARAEALVAASPAGRS